MEVNRVAYFALAVTPAAAECGTTHPALDRSIPHHFHILVCRSASDAARQIQLDARRLCLRIAELKHPRSRSSREFCHDTVVLQSYSIVVCLYVFVCVAINRAPALTRMVDPPAVQLHGPGGRHYLQIAEVAVVSHSAHVCKAEAFNRILFIRVARAVVAFEGVAWTFNASSNRVRAELHHAKRGCWPREGLALAQ